MRRHTTDVVFLTGFSDGCYRAIPAAAQLADDLDMRLTLLHAFDPRRESREAAEGRLASFFPEADRFDGARRVVLPGTPVEAALAHAARHRVDLFLAPGTDRLRPLRLGASTRARLIAACEAPVWTLGGRVPPARGRRPARRIACWLDPDSDQGASLRLAAALVEELGGELHLLHVLPDLHEGSLNEPRTPLGPDEVVVAARRHLGRDDLPLQVHVSPGGSAGATLDLVRRCDPDLLVIGPRHAVRRGPLGARVGRLVDGAACPVLCVGPALVARGGPSGRRVPAGADEAPSGPALGEVMASLAF